MLFDETGRLLEPVSVIGRGAVGTVYKARHYTHMATRSILAAAGAKLATDNVEGQASQPPDPLSKGTLSPGQVAPSPTASELTRGVDSTALFAWVAVKEVAFEETRGELDDVLKEAGLTYSIRSHPFIVGYRGSFVHSGATPEAPHWQRLGVEEASVEELVARMVGAKTTSSMPNEKGTLRPGQQAPLQSTESAGESAPLGQQVRFSSRPAMCIVQELITGVSVSEYIVAQIERQQQLQQELLRTPHMDVNSSDMISSSILPPPHRPPSMDVAVLARSVLLALAYLHTTARLAHRDVKCSNILIQGDDETSSKTNAAGHSHTQRGRVVLCDFGASGAVDTPLSKRFTAIGTPGWIAPEILSNTMSSTGSGHGLLSDIWSFGILMLQLALLRPASNTNDAVFANAVRHFTSVPCARPPSVSGALPDVAEDDDGASDIVFGGTPSSSSSRRSAVAPAASRSTFNLPPGEKLLTPVFQDFIACCLRRDPSSRWSASALLRHPFLVSELGDDHIGHPPEHFAETVQGMLAWTLRICPEFGVEAKLNMATQNAPLYQVDKSTARRDGKAESRQFHFGNLDRFSKLFSDGKSKAAVVSSSPNTPLRSDPAIPSWVHPSITKESSKAVLNHVLIPAARAAPLVAEKIVRNYEPVWAMYVGDPRFVEESSPNSAGPPPSALALPTTPVALEAQELLLKYTAVGTASLAPTTLPEMLRQFQMHPVESKHAQQLMAKQVELLTKLEGRLPGFSEELMRRFMGRLAGKIAATPHHSQSSHQRTGGEGASFDEESDLDASNPRPAGNTTSNKVPSSTPSQQNAALKEIRARSQLFRKLQQDPLQPPGSGSSFAGRSRGGATSGADPNATAPSVHPTEALLSKLCVPHWSSATLYCHEREAALASYPVGQSRSTTGPPAEAKAGFYLNPPKMPGVAPSAMKPGEVDATAYLYNSMMDEYLDSL